MLIATERAILTSKKSLIEGSSIVHFISKVFFQSNFLRIDNCPLANLLKKWCKEFGVEQKQFEYETK